MDNHFDFLKQAGPASLYRLLERLPLADAAVVLAGLPASASVQVMAYFSESRQGELMPVLREARQGGPERAAAVAARVKEILAATKRGDAGAAPGGAMEKGREAALPPQRPVQSTQPPAPPPPSVAAARPPQPQRRAGAPRRERGHGNPSQTEPTPWTPRAATSSPINGPALPGKPPPLDGDPLRSPLVRAGLLDLIGRAQEKLLPKGKSPSTPAPDRGGARPLPPKAATPGKRPPAMEGMIRSERVEMSRTPRVVGLPGGGKGKAAKPAGDGARRMDGKAILAAILREAGGEVRSHVRQDDPALFKELRSRMFHFDDLLYSDDNALARVFTAAPAAESSLALRFAAPALRDRVFRVVSPGRAEALRDVKPGRAGVDSIEMAQKKVLDVALQLQAAGRILIDPRDPDLAGA